MIIDFERITQFFKQKYFIDISVYDRSFLEKVTRSRMISTFCNNSDTYFYFLKNNPEEPALLISQLNNSYSEFFRNELTFAIIERVVIPKLVDDKEKSRSGDIRIWSAGCASGQEPYSLAMLFDNYKSSKISYFDFKIFATDNSIKEIESGRAGIFDFRSVKNTRLEFAEKYFAREGESFLVDGNLKKQVDFSFYDILDPKSSSPPSSIYGDFDLIMCCNVLFYYQPEYQKQIINKFQKSLRHGGIFITGEAEILAVNSHSGFKPFAPLCSIFIKN
jgi:chemotaxis methyl-accepting protein methylase